MNKDTQTLLSKYGSLYLYESKVSILPLKSLQVIYGFQIFGVWSVNICLFCDQLLFIDLSISEYFVKFSFIFLFDCVSQTHLINISWASSLCKTCLSRCMSEQGIISVLMSNGKGVQIVLIKRKKMRNSIWKS